MSANNDIEAWVEELRRVASPASRKEIRLIRKLFGDRRTSGTLPGVNEQRWREFLQRMEAEGLLSQAERRNVRPGATGIRRYWMASANTLRFAMAAAVAVLAVGLSVTVYWQHEDRMPGETDEIVIRGDRQLQRIEADDPAALAGRISAVLIKHQLVMHRLDHADNVQIQAKVPLEATAAKEELAQLGVEVPSHGRLDLLIVRK